MIKYIMCKVVTQNHLKKDIIKKTIHMFVEKKDFPCPADKIDVKLLAHLNNTLLWCLVIELELE